MEAIITCAVSFITWFIVSPVTNESPEIEVKDPLTVPSSNAVATVLMIITVILFLGVEKFRSRMNRGMF